MNDALVGERLRPANDRILTALPDEGGPVHESFDGGYGGIYNKVIRSPRLRRAVFTVWGSADPIYRLESFVADAIPKHEAVVLDVPCGGGTLIRMLAGLRGTLIELDLSMPMLSRAVAAHDEAQPAFDVEFVQADALDLPLADASADVVLSVNGLHVVPDPGRFLTELARVTKPGGGLWLVTPVDGPGFRSRTILRAANRLGVTPRTPPSLAQLRELVDASGFDLAHDYGGASITGFAARRR